MKRRLVVDSSVFLAWLLREPSSQRAEAMIDEYLFGSLRLLTLDLAWLEVASVVSNRARLQRISRAEASGLLADFRTCAPTGESSVRFIEAGLDVSIHLGLALYDCLYLAFALEEGCDFITADERFFHAVRHSYPNVKLL